MSTLVMRHDWPIGFRRTRTPWQQDLPALLAFANDAGFAFLDFGPIDAETAQASLAAGVPVGTVDLKDWSALLSPDAGVRAAAVMTNASHLRSHVAMGVTKFLTVIAPADPARLRRENFDFAVESYRSLCGAAAECGATILIEGAPGRPPHFANLACTPADLRALLSAVDSPALGVNYDPSHLVRMGIDPVRFLKEFAGAVHHVHAKDTLFVSEARYEHGSLQQATFADAFVYGGHDWRYALPGRGATPWKEIFAALHDIGYTGRISIELEDGDYLGSADAEKKGLLEAAAFLKRVE